LEIDGAHLDCARERHREAAAFEHDRPGRRAAVVRRAGGARHAHGEHGTDRCHGGEAERERASRLHQR